MFIFFSILFIFAQRKIKNLGADGKSLDVCPVISRATLDTVLRCALSYVDTGIQSTDRYENNIHIKEVFSKCLVCIQIVNQRNLVIGFISPSGHVFIGNLNIIPDARVRNTIS